MQIYLPLFYCIYIYICLDHPCWIRRLSSILSRPFPLLLTAWNWLLITLWLVRGDKSWIAFFVSYSLILGLTFFVYAIFRLLHWYNFFTTKDSLNCKIMFYSRERFDHLANTKNSLCGFVNSYWAMFFLYIIFDIKRIVWIFFESMLNCYKGIRLQGGYIIFVFFSDGMSR